MKKSILAFMLIATATILFSCKKELPTDQPAITSAATLEKLTFEQDVTGTFFNPCTNEDVQTTGYILVRLHQVTNFDKSINYGYTLNYANVHGKGAQSGHNYKCTGIVSVNVRMVYNTLEQDYFVVSQNVNNRTVWNSQDGAPDLVGIFKIHIFCDINGTTKIDGYKLEFDICK